MGDTSEFSLTVRLFLKAYSWRKIDPVPWTPLKKPLFQAKLALVSSAGFVLPGQQSFDESFKGGDPSFRRSRQTVNKRRCWRAIAANPLITPECSRTRTLPFRSSGCASWRPRVASARSTIATFPVWGHHGPRPSHREYRAAGRTAFGRGRGGCGALSSGLTHVQPDRVSGGRRIGSARGISTVVIQLLRNVAEKVRPPRALFVPF